jgi:hypothetical protein
MMADDKDEPFQRTAADVTSADQGALIAASSAAQAPDEGSGSEQIAASAPEIGRAAKPDKPKRPSTASGLAAALIVGAIGGFGGAFALRYFDTLQGPDPVDRIAEANARADALEHKNAASDAALAALQSRVAAVEEGAGKKAATTDAALGELRKALETRPVVTADGQEIQAPDLAPMQQKIDALEGKLGSLDAVQQKVGEIETTLAKPKVDTEAEQARVAAEHNAKALSAVQSMGVVAASLVQLVSRGEPFSNEVDALANLGVAPAKLAPLRATASTGVADIGDLADQFAALAPSLEAPDAPTPDTGVLERLARDASNLVHIRRAGDPHELDLPGRIAAIEGALVRLDVGKAYAIWSQLPGAAKAKSANWGAAAKARLDALSAANAIEADAVSALSKMKS